MATQTPLSGLTTSVDPDVVEALQQTEPETYEAARMAHFDHAVYCPLQHASDSSTTRLATHVPLTIHAFPSLEPLRLEAWSARHLGLPLRRDMVHSAVVYEADKARQGTASTKTRWEVRGSGRKLYPQKGTGRARVGDKKSPIRRGGGVVFGPHPRDFATGLNRKVYDRAWRMALSHRYRRGELLVVEDAGKMLSNGAIAGSEEDMGDFGDAAAISRGLDLPPLPAQLQHLLALYPPPPPSGPAPHVPFKKTNPARAAAPKGARLVPPSEDVQALRTSYLRRTLTELLSALGWGLRQGRTLFVTSERREALFDAVLALNDGLVGKHELPAHGRTAAAALAVDDVDVRAILKGARVVIEREALRRMLEEHQSDLETKIWMGGLPPTPPSVDGVVVVG